MQFSKATKKAARLRLALMGPAGSGKTYTGLNVAKHLGGKIAVIDTEHGSASKYADVWDFDTLHLDSFHPRRYVEAIKAAEAAGYDVLLIDSLSHAWIGKDGGLDLHDQAVAKQKTKNSFTAWADVTPHHMALIEAILQCKCHVIATMRTKTEYVQEKDDRTGRTAVRKVGTAPLMRDGAEYEFDVVGDLDIENTLVITKTRCPVLSGAVIRKPGQELADTLKAWLGGGETVTPAPNGTPQPVHQGAAHPKVGSAPAGSAPSPVQQKTASNLPANGTELLARLQAFDAKLAAAGLCQPANLLNHVAQMGNKVQGLPAEIDKWTGAAIPFGVEVALQFADARKAAKAAAPAAPAAPPLQAGQDFYSELDMADAQLYRDGVLHNDEDPNRDERGKFREMIIDKMTERCRVPREPSKWTPEAIEVGRQASREYLAELQPA